MTVVEATCRLVSIYGSYDRGRRRWFAAAFSIKS